jgi:polyhydroxyalkanoate synthesis regulator protein
MIGSYLEQSLKLFAGQQRDARDRTKGVGDAEPALPLNNLAQKNYQRWRQVQDEIYRTLLNAGRNAGTRSELVEEEQRAE